MFRLRTPSYRLHKTSGQAFVELNCRRIYLGKYGSETSQTRYRRLVAEWLANPATVTLTNTAAGEHLHQRNVACRLEVCRKLPQYTGTLSQELVSIRDALRPVQEFYGLAPATEFGPPALKAVRQTLIEKGLARGVIISRVNRSQRALQWAVSEELVPSSIYETLRTVSGLKRGRSAARETEPVKPVTRAYVEAVLPNVAFQVAAMIHSIATVDWHAAHRH